MNPTTNYDVIIIGAGPSGIFCAYELIQKKPGMKILMVEKGAPLKRESVQNALPRYVWAANPVPSPRASQAQAHFPTANCPCPLMWEAIFLKYWDTIKRLNS